jgi:alkylation response protein AidB-like acyl-CoA dehydrogenase
MLNAANLSFALCPLLTDGAIEALLTAGSDELKATYLEKLVSGQWTGTMNLTEPQAGSDLAAVRTRRAAGRRHLQDLRHQDLHHLRRARHGREHRPPGAGARAGRARGRQGHQPVRGARSSWSMPTARLGERNDVHCVSIEHKMGIKASPTAVLQFGDHGGAIGYLVGEEPRPRIHVHHDERRALRRRRAGHRGGRARLPEGRGLRQGARAKPPGRRQHQGAATIIHHPDVRRMLMTMRAQTEGCRAMASTAAAAYDAAHHHLTPRRASRTRPSMNSWCRWSRATAPR